MEKELLINADEAFSEIIEQIKSAEDSIYICMYIWRDDKIGNLIAQELIKAADRGVNVEIIKDKAGSVFEKIELKKQSFFHKQKEVSLSIKGWFLSYLYYRENKCSKSQVENKKFNQMLDHQNITVNFKQERHDHSKYFVFDNRVLLLGGMNIGDKITENNKQKYRDYMVKLCSEELITLFWDKLKGKKPNNNYQNIEFYFNKREQNLYQIKPKVLELLDQARYRADIEMAYFGDSDITDKIIELCNRGVNVTIITSRNSNVQPDLNKCVLQKLIDKCNQKLEVYLSNQLVHSKFMCVDRKNFFLGSANFHKLGMEQLSELNVLIRNDRSIYDKWISWREDHLKECTLISEPSNLKYNKLIALTERVLC